MSQKYLHNFIQYSKIMELTQMAINRKVNYSKKKKKNDIHEDQSPQQYVHRG